MGFFSKHKAMKKGINTLKKITGKKVSTSPFKADTVIKPTTKKVSKPVERKVIATKPINISSRGRGVGKTIAKAAKKSIPTIKDKVKQKEFTNAFKKVKPSVIGGNPFLDRARKNKPRPSILSGKGGDEADRRFRERMSNRPSERKVVATKPNQVKKGSFKSMFDTARAQRDSGMIQGRDGKLRRRSPTTPEELKAQILEDKARGDKEPMANRPPSWLLGDRIMSKFRNRPREGNTSNAAVQSAAAKPILGTMGSGNLSNDPLQPTRQPFAPSLAPRPSVQSLSASPSVQSLSASPSPMTNNLGMGTEYVAPGAGVGTFTSEDAFMQGLGQYLGLGARSKETDILPSLVGKEPGDIRGDYQDIINSLQTASKGYTTGEREAMLGQQRQAMQASARAAGSMGGGLRGGQRLASLIQSKLGGVAQQAGAMEEFARMNRERKQTAATGLQQLEMDIESLNRQRRENYQQNLRDTILGLSNLKTQNRIYRESEE